MGSIRGMLFVVLTIGVIGTGGCSARGQQPAVHAQSDAGVIGGGCEGCDLMYVGMPDAIGPTHTSVGWLRGRQRLTITGRVMQRDGRTPARDVIVYYWHTNVEGTYAPDAKTPQAARAHGALRGWVRTDSTGIYTIRTSRPAAYPRETIPQHIHLSIKEPTLRDPYYADLYFDDDPLYLQHKKKYGRIDRAGTELLRVLLADDRSQVAEHDIVLGLNIPFHPATASAAADSAPEVGEDQPSFMPYHAFGPDSGTRACPVCKYGRHVGVLVFVGVDAPMADVRSWLAYLEQASAIRGERLKAYLVFGDATVVGTGRRMAELQQLGRDMRVRRTALTFVPSFDDEESEVHLNGIDPATRFTVVVYHHRTIIDRVRDAAPNESTFARITRAIDGVRRDHEALQEPQHD